MNELQPIVDFAAALGPSIAANFATEWLKRSRQGLPPAIQVEILSQLVLEVERVFDGIRILSEQAAASAAASAAGAGAAAQAARAGSQAASASHEAKAASDATKAAADAVLQRLEDVGADIEALRTGHLDILDGLKTIEDFIQAAVEATPSKRKVLGAATANQWSTRHTRGTAGYWFRRVEALEEIEVELLQAIGLDVLLGSDRLPLRIIARADLDDYFALLKRLERSPRPDRAREAARRDASEVVSNARLVADSGPDHLAYWQVVAKLTSQEPPLLARAGVPSEFALPGYELSEHGKAIWDFMQMPAPPARVNDDKE